MKLSTIISAYHKTPLILRHVKECMNSSLIPDEIIVINDHGDDFLLQELKTIPRKCDIVYAWIKDDIKWNYTGARNLGLFLSRGKYISVEDDDHIPHPDFYKDAVAELEKGANKVKTHKRYVISEEDIINKPMSEWEHLSSRVAHEDCCVFTRELLTDIKGYDERFAGAYGWAATDTKRRTNRHGHITSHAGYQYVANSPKTRGLSSRNWKMAREQRETQSPIGILNFNYEITRIKK